MSDIPADFPEPSENIVSVVFHRRDVEGPAGIIAGCTERANFAAYHRAIRARHPTAEVVEVDLDRQNDPRRLADEAAVMKHLRARIAAYSASPPDDGA